MLLQRFEAGYFSPGSKPFAGYCSSPGCMKSPACMYRLGCNKKSGTVRYRALCWDCVMSKVKSGQTNFPASHSWDRPSDHFSSI